MGGGAKCKRHRLHFRDRHDIAQNAAHERKELNLSANEHLQRLGVAARYLVVLRYDLGRDTAARFAPDRIPHLHQAAMKRALGCLIMELR
jgi:hypothetical protein